MDLPYNTSILHSSNGAQQVSHTQKEQSAALSRKKSSVWQAATQIGVDAIESFGSVASHTLRLPVDAVGAVTHLAFHPGEIFSKPRSASAQREYERLARRTRLLQQLSHAESWAEYYATCVELDQIEGAEVWKDADDSLFYDVRCLRGRLRRLRAASEEDDVEEMLRLIRCELSRDLGGICNPLLHQQTRAGTKFLIHHYIATVREALDRIVGACAAGDRRLLKLNIQAELEQTRRSYGRTALLLSGGGTLGMSHIGVIKALHEANALPRIISGSSSGSIVAAVLGCTNDDDLLPRLFDFCHGDLAVFVGPHEKQGWSARAEHFGKHGYMFDLGNLRRVMVDLLGKTTFIEAYNRTRRVLNITVSNSTNYESQQVLNYATAGNVVIWSAVVASCAVPLGFEPERLLLKRDNETKDLAPWDPTTRYVDGSINGDLPTSILSAEFDVNHSIVSQVNPHVTPFLSTPTQSQRNHYWIGAAELAREEAIRSMELFSNLPCLERNNNLVTKMTSILAQRYSGDITLLPVDATICFWTILKNPTSDFMEESTHQGERATWPVLNMIKAHMDIELLVDDAVRKVSEHVSFSQSVSDLRRLRFKGATPDHSSGGRMRNSSARNKTSRDGLRSKPPAGLRIDVAPPKANGVKFALEQAPITSSSSSDSESTVLDSEDEMIDHQRRHQSSKTLSIPEEGLWAIQTQPNTPVSERKGFLDDSRPASPGFPPMSLVMTPVTPRDSSPEANIKRQRSGHGRRRSTTWSPPPLARTSSPTEQRDHSPRMRFSSFQARKNDKRRSGRESPVERRTSYKS